jgi:hypothetical protein
VLLGVVAVLGALPTRAGGVGAVPVLLVPLAPGVVGRGAVAGVVGVVPAGGEPAT